MERKNYAIFSQRLAGWLMWHGFVLIDINPNNDGSGRNVFYFNDTDDLQDAMKKYEKPE